MENCLKTQLKENISNFLPKLGETIIQVIEPSDFIFNVTGEIHSETPIIRAESAVIYALDSTGSKTGEPMQSCNWYDVNAYGIGVDNSYNGKLYINLKHTGQDWTIEGGTVDLRYIENLRSVNNYVKENSSFVDKFHSPFELNLICKNGEFHTDGLFATTHPEIERFQSSGSGGYIVHDMQKIISSLTAVVSFQGYQSSYINMASFADLGKIASLTLFAHDNKYSWRLEDFVANKRSVGETSGSGKVLYANDDSYGGVASFNGQKMTSETAFSWTATTITYNGVTINA